MYPNLPNPESDVPEEFTLYVKQVLENFYDFPLLNNHLLAKAIKAPRTRPTETDGQRLRRIFISAIEELKPGTEAAPKALQARFYNLINLHYIESSTMQFVAHELGISERQAYRDLKRAEESLASFLWERMGQAMSTPAVVAVPTLAAIETDTESLELQLRPTSAQELLKNASKAVERLAKQQNIQIQLNLPSQPVLFSTDSRLAQQILINLLSHILQHAQTQSVEINLEQQADQVTMSFLFQMEDCADCLKFDNPVANQFIRYLKWKLDPGTLTPSGSQIIRLMAGQPEAVVLVIDDHPPLIELLRRYLTNTRCQVVGISDGQAGLGLARSLAPDVILLDVMMPGIDGWEVLQRLRYSPETAQIPVVICSIFNDPKLAYSLGATALLTKPVKREDLYAVLRSLKILE